MPRNRFDQVEIMAEAERLYRARCKQAGCPYQHPSDGSGIEGHYAVLRSLDGILARYKIVPQDGSPRLAWVNLAPEQP
jgi:hypothetical protein